MVLRPRTTTLSSVGGGGKKRLDVSERREIPGRKRCIQPVAKERKKSVHIYTYSGLCLVLYIHVVTTSPMKF